MRMFKAFCAFEPETLGAGLSFTDWVNALGIDKIAIHMFFTWLDSLVEAHMCLCQRGFIDLEALHLKFLGNRRIS